MASTKPQSRSKRRFCGFRFLTSQLLAIKRVTQLLFFADQLHLCNTGESEASLKGVVHCF